MAKPLQTQWDFGKTLTLAGPSERRVFSVAEITAKIRSTLETAIGFAWVTGEITNLRLQSSGHAYFTLKDQYAQLNCVLFKADGRSIDRSLLKDGQTVILQGEMTVYEVRGQYQMRVVGLELQGAGKLQALFELLKQKLAAEGLFAAERKRRIPLFPQRLGLVTSKDGAALHDVLHVIERRQPGLGIFLAACRVQGAGAEREIARSIRILNDWSDTREKLDLILLTRGGGSLEDLWAFNEEETARAIVDSKVPIISAIGHEIDFTISDFAADFRAATPSAAAELITEGASSSRQQLRELASRLARFSQQLLKARREELRTLRRALERRPPARLLRERQQRLDELREHMERVVSGFVRTAQERFQHSGNRFRRLRLADRVRRMQSELMRADRQLQQLSHQQLKRTRQAALTLQSQLRLLGPQQTLNRGYSITRDASTGVILRDPAQTKLGQTIRTTVARGEIFSSTCDRKSTEPT